MNLDRFAILTVIFLLGSCSQNRLSEKSLSRYKPGYDFDLFLKKTGLDKKEFDQTPNISTEQIHGKYHLKEGVIFVSAEKNKQGKWMLDSIPWILKP